MAEAASPSSEKEPPSVEKEPPSVEKENRSGRVRAFRTSVTWDSPAIVADATFIVVMALYPL
jgi:hypothetical protein